MIKKLIGPVAFVLFLLESGLLFDEKRLSTQVISGIRGVDKNITTGHLEVLAEENQLLRMENQLLRMEVSNATASIKVEAPVDVAPAEKDTPKAPDSDNKAEASVETPAPKKVEGKRQRWKRLKQEAAKKAKEAEEAALKASTPASEEKKSDQENKKEAPVTPVAPDAAPKSEAENETPKAPDSSKISVPAVDATKKEEAPVAPVAPPKSQAENNAPKAADASQLSPEERAERERLYYDHHYQQLNALVNDTTLLSWNKDRKKMGKYNKWLGNFDAFSLPKDWRSANFTRDFSETDKIFFRCEDLCRAAKVFTEYRNNTNNPPKPHILLGKLNQDTGSFSSSIRGKTGRFKSLPQLWIKYGCSEQFVMDYINHPDTLAVFTIQYQKYSNPKVISIPLGLSAGGNGGLIPQMNKYVPAKNRTDFLMINMKLWAGRKSAYAAIEKTFQNHSQGVPTNTYKNFTGSGYSGYYDQMAHSKFLLSPSGLGVDCYRNWESMYMGVIPVIEKLNKHDGWFERTLADLPVAWIDDFKHLTPEYLEKEYDRIVINKPPTAYKFEKLTRQYWIQMAYSIIEEHKHKLSKTSRRRWLR